MLTEESTNVGTDEMQDCWSLLFESTSRIPGKRAKARIYDAGSKGFNQANEIQKGLDNAPAGIWTRVVGLRAPYAWPVYTTGAKLNPMKI